jgi:uncharacterized protein YqgV (UPF0045/DUF77 family)
MLAEIQVMPRPAGTAADRYAHVDAAIAVIESSGLIYEVGPLGTTVQGDPDAIWPVLRAVHDATIAAGASACATVIKVSDSREDSAPTLAGLVAKFRS